MSSPRSPEPSPHGFEDARVRPVTGPAESVAEALARHEQAEQEGEWTSEEMNGQDAGLSEMVKAQVSPVAHPEHVTLEIPPDNSLEGLGLLGPRAGRGANTSGRSLLSSRSPGTGHSRRKGSSRKLSDSHPANESSESHRKSDRLGRRSTGGHSTSEGIRPLRTGFAFGERLLNFGRKEAPAANGTEEDEDEDEVLSHDDDDGESETLDIDLEDPAARWSSVSWLWSFVLCAGVALLVAGLVVEFVSTDHEAARALLVVSSGLLLWPLSAQIVRSMLWIAQALYKRSRRRLSIGVLGVAGGTGSGTAYYYMLEARGSMRFLIWAVLTEVVTLAVFPYSGVYEQVYFHASRVLASLIFIFIASTVVTLICVRLSQNFNTQAYLARMAETLRHESIIYGLCAVRPQSHFSALYDEVINEHESGEGGQLDPDVWGRAMRYINTHRADGTELPDGHVHTQTRGSVKAANARLAAETSRLAKFIFDKLFVLCDTARRIERDQAKQGIRRTLSSGALVEMGAEEEEGSDDPSNNRTTGSAGSRNSGETNSAMTSLGRNSVFELTTAGDARRRGSNLWGLFRPNSNHQTPRELAQLQHTDSMRALSKEPANVRDRRRIYKAQFVQVVGKFHPELEAYANEIWDKHFDPTGTGYSKLKRVSRFLQVMFKARKNMSLTLQDSQTVFQGVRKFMLALFLIVVFMIILTLYNINVSEVWFALTGALLAWSFVFGETMRGLFECMVFLLDLHPYDVGDQIEFNGDRYEVRRIYLRSTELLTPVGSMVLMENRHIYASNSIINYSRSENRIFWATILVDMTDITDELLKELRAEFAAFLRNNAERFDPRDYAINCRSIGPMLKCEVKYIWIHAYPFISLDRTYNDQDLMIAFICQSLSRHSVHYSGSGLGRIPFDLPSTARAASDMVAQSHDPGAALPGPASESRPGPPAAEPGVLASAARLLPESLRPSSLRASQGPMPVGRTTMARHSRTSSQGNVAHYQPVAASPESPDTSQFMPMSRNSSF